MHFKKHSVVTAAAVGMMGAANAAALKERDDSEAFVVMHQVVSQSPSIVYATVTSSVENCGTISCPVSTSTVVELTTYCPVTMTETSTVGNPTHSGPLSTITTSVTVPGPGVSETSSTAVPTESGPGGAPPAEPSSGSAVGVPGATSVSPESTGPDTESTLFTTIRSTSYLLTTVTVTGSTGTETQTLTSAPATSAAGPSSSSAVGVPGVASETTSTSFSFAPSSSDVSSFSTNTVNPIGGTASSSGFITPTTNGTLVTPTPTAPTQSIVPFTGGAEGMKYASVFGSAIVMAAAALFL